MIRSTFKSRRQRNPNAPDEQRVNVPFFVKSGRNGIQRQPGQPFFTHSGSEVSVSKKDIQPSEKDPEKEKAAQAGQKKEIPVKEEEKKDKDHAVQKKSDHSPGKASSSISSRIESSSGKGNSLSHKTNMEMSRAFGMDFSSVRVHTDRESVFLNSELGAQAFTHGSDVYFNQGKYNPETASGKSLLAHELTHVFQQKEGIQEKRIQQKVVAQNVTTNDAITATVGKSRQEIIDAITDADADAIVLAQNAEDMMTAQLANAIAKAAVDPDAELILNEELGLSYNNPAHHGLIRQQIFRFKRVRETLLSGYLRYLALGINNVDLIGCSTGNCGPNFAFSCPGNRLIVLCQAFWDNPDQQSATVLHEPFHIWFHMAFHAATALLRADATCFESFALRASGRSAFASCDTHTAG
jgi:hypothetical protein